MPQKDSKISYRGAHGILIFAVLISVGADTDTAGETEIESESNGMMTFWTTSHSLAVAVPRPKSLASTATRVEKANRLAWSELQTPPPSSPEEAWWWLVAVPQGHDEKDSDQQGEPLPWSKLTRAFNHTMTPLDRYNMMSAMAHPEDDDFHIADPKAQTVRLSQELPTGWRRDVYFRATPQGECIGHSRPPFASFLPEALPPVPEKHCVLELCNLVPDTDYRVVLFAIDDGFKVPAEEPKASFVSSEKTAPQQQNVQLAVKILQFSCYVAMGLSVMYQMFLMATSARENLAGYTKVAPLTADTLTMQAREAGSMAGFVGPGGFHQEKLSSLSLEILKDVALSLTMFLPLVGPLGLLLASHVVVGVRLRNLVTSWTSLRWTSLDLWISIVSVLVNVVVIPMNMWAVQALWFEYCSGWFTSIGLNVMADHSFGSFQRRYDLWMNVSGVELVGWIPAVFLSAYMLTLNMHKHRVAEKLQLHKDRATEQLKQLPRGKKFYDQLCEMEHLTGFRDSNIPYFESTGEPLGNRPVQQDVSSSSVSARLIAAVMAISLAFSLVPHLWMCAVHGVPFWNGPMMVVTFMYFVNMTGVCARFLLLTERTRGSTSHKCAQLAVFQALSWQEETSRDLYDPFSTRNDAVVRARLRLREESPELQPLRLEQAEEAQIWWKLRELLLVDLKAEGVMMEMLVLMSIALVLLTGSFSLVVAFKVEKITSISIVTAMVNVVLLRFTYYALSNARDINLMSKEHALLLHGVVAQMATKPPRSLENQLRQERFLLQLATLVEKQHPPESVMSFDVTPELFSSIIVVTGALTATAIWNLGSGFVKL
eukprot:CAMPEP_0170578242 /NCGR_PEP_ID=MMETSP0224-20130122/5352_1 /TAXON_ID=285029 /ORGANISM="Togula jolla, Strain CCCM 725" /LENGTH=824 /DNA_ID=CAMNT_0010901199 /DNA_START=36 /DNA_END=2510 /DNA_ORIENTATION=+